MEQKKYDLLIKGDVSSNGQVTIIDKDRLCYLVKNVSHGSSGIRTISKKLLGEYIDHLIQHPSAKPNDVRKALCGNSTLDRFEYGYTSTLLIMAEMCVNKFKNGSQIPTFSGAVVEQGQNYRPFITAIRTKPFLLLAGISGTGKSRIVRELARACWDVNTEDYKAQKPRNFEMVQVKPNWHDSSELIGYVSRVNGVHYVVGPFLKFMVKAINDPKTPYFLCLDEMNLAPVEQYFAEYLSVIESRKLQDNGFITTDPIVDFSNTDEYKSLIDQLFAGNDKEKNAYLTEVGGKRLRIPQNLIVVGTVNMDETTFSFSRKVLDRAMTIEMNDVDLYGGLGERYEQLGKLEFDDLIGSAVEGVDVYGGYKEVCNIALEYLGKINKELEGTPFKVAYRTRNEFLLYVVNNLSYSKDEKGNELPRGYVIARALDEITSMKILSRIEGDDTKVGEKLLNALSVAIEQGLQEVTDDEHPVESVSIAKLNEMRGRLTSGYTSFWS